MAGIGFELRKIMKKDGLSNKLNAVFASLVITTGPYILSIVLIMTINYMMNIFNIDDYDQLVLSSITSYAFIFSVIIVSLFSLPLIRFLSDKLYEEKYKELLSAFYGGVVSVVVVSSFVAAIFLIKAELEFNTKILSYILFNTLSITWVQSMFITAVKKYRLNIITYAIGVLVSLSCIYLNFKYLNNYSINYMLIFIIIGFVIINLSYTISIIREFRGHADDIFGFYKYFSKYPPLIFINFLYSVSLFIDNIILWNSPYGNKILGVFYFFEMYDKYTFYAFLTIIPVSVMFVINYETVLYENIELLYKKISFGGNLEDVRLQISKLIRKFSREFKKLLEMQLIFSLLGILIFLKTKEYEQSMNDDAKIFIYLVFGTYLLIFSNIVQVTLLYFDERKYSLIISIVLIFMNVSLTLLSLQYNITYIGLSFLLSGCITFLVSIYLLKHFMKNLLYNIFCR